VSDSPPPPYRGPPWSDGSPAVLSESFRVRGGAKAPRTARLAVRSLLEERVADRQLRDVELIVSELVTNSVRHAGVDLGGSLTVGVLLIDDRLRLCVGDAGSSLLPRRREREATTPGGLGLPLVEQLSSSWGVARDGSGATRVWSEVAVSA
jgi:serine/threonine-protein kinase RsbW